MNTRLARLAGEARKHALSCKRTESLADIGRAENQPVDIRVVGGTVDELEREIDRLQHRLENQARTIRTQANTITMLLERFDVEHGVQVVAA